MYSSAVAAISAASPLWTAGSWLILALIWFARTAILRPASVCDLRSIRQWMMKIPWARAHVRRFDARVSTGWPEDGCEETMKLWKSSRSKAVLEA